jgi:hypothetical protein
MCSMHFVGLPRFCLYIKHCRRSFTSNHTWPLLLVLPETGYAVIAFVSFELYIKFDDYSFADAATEHRSVHERFVDRIWQFGLYCVVNSWCFELYSRKLLCQQKSKWSEKNGFRSTLSFKQSMNANLVFCFKESSHNTRTKS